MVKRLFALFFLVFLLGYAQDINSGLIVTGEGTVESEPDLAIVRLGASLQDRTADKVYQATNTTIDAIIKALVKIGIKLEDIKSEGVGLYPQYDYADGKQKFIGYQMNHNLSIKVKKIDKIADVLDNATYAGANTISGISFGFQDPEKFMSQARLKAIDAAEKKAKEIAQNADIKLGRIIQITESSYPVDFSRTLETGANAQSTIVPGTNSVRASVTIRYEILETKQ
jgi:uncharacterized protein